MSASTLPSPTRVILASNRILVNGEDVTPDSKQITISVTGDVPQLTVDACHTITVNGNVGSLKTTSGDVQAHNVGQSVTTVSGDVECGDVGGSVTTTSGDVDCGAVQGRVSTISGDIEHKRR